MSHANLSAQIDRYAYINAFARSSPATKIFFALSALIASVSSPIPIVPIIVFLSNAVLLLYFAKIPKRFYLNLLMYPTIAVVISCIFIALFFGYGTPLTQVVLPWFSWTVFKNGVSMAVATLFRVEGAISATYFLVLTTSMTDIFIALRKVHVPKILVEMCLLIYRYIFVFIEVTQKMLTAQKLRLGHSGWIRKTRSIALLAGNLFIRTLEQGERTFTAMNARGYDGNIRVIEELPRPKKATLLGVILFDVALVLVLLFTLNVGVV